MLKKFFKLTSFFVFLYLVFICEADSQTVFTNYFQLQKSSSSFDGRVARLSGYLYQDCNGRYWITSYESENRCFSVLTSGIEIVLAPLERNYLPIQRCLDSYVVIHGLVSFNYLWNKIEFISIPSVVKLSGFDPNNPLVGVDACD